MAQQLMFGWPRIRTLPCVPRDGDAMLKGSSSIDNCLYIEERAILEELEEEVMMRGEEIGSRRGE